MESDQYVNDILVLLTCVAKHRGDRDYWMNQTQEKIAEWCGPSMTQPRVSYLLSIDEKYGLNESHFAKTAHKNGFRYKIYNKRRFHIDVVYDGACRDYGKKDYFELNEIEEFIE